MYMTGLMYPRTERGAGDGLVPVAGGDAARQPHGQRGQRRGRHALAPPLRRRQAAQGAARARRHRTSLCQGKITIHK